MEPTIRITMTAMADMTATATMIMDYAQQDFDDDLDSGIFDDF